MTQCVIPDLVTAILAKELHATLHSILAKIAEDYNLPIEELETKYNTPLHIIDSKTEKVKITMKRHYNKHVSKDERCIARTWNQGNGGRCRWKRTPDSEFCKNHFKLHEKGQLKHGTIKDVAPSEIFTPSSRKERLF